jgi:ribosomal protein S20
MDKAAKTGIIHQNKAARAKSAMAKVLTPAKK